MFKPLTKTTKLFGGLIAIVLIIIVILISLSGNKITPGSPVHYISDNASADNKVEALKTMTADLINVENKNNALQASLEQLKTQNEHSVRALKKSFSDQLKLAMQHMQAENTEQQKRLALLLPVPIHSNADTYPIQDHDTQGAFTWVSDMAPSTSEDSSNTKKNSLRLTHLGDDFFSENSSTRENRVNRVSPLYTIPMNATLTGATLMTPLIGRVPIDGKLPSPYPFKLVLSANNLTANGYPLTGIQGAVMSGIASGDMLGHCARGEIQSITFVFNDGTISTTHANGEDHSLGYLSSRLGDPCIVGTFHSDAGLFLGAQMGLAGLQGYANAFSNSQYRNTTTPEGSLMSTLIGSANQAALGQGVSAASTAAQTWWNRRVENSFDYVYVPNVNPKTGEVMKVVVNITQQISINHDAHARKVSYENTEKNTSTQLD